MATSSCLAYVHIFLENVCALWVRELRLQVLTVLELYVIRNKMRLNCFSPTAEEQETHRLQHSHSASKKVGPQCWWANLINLPCSTCAHLSAQLGVPSSITTTLMDEQEEVYLQTNVSVVYRNIKMLVCLSEAVFSNIQPRAPRVLGDYRRSYWLCRTQPLLKTFMFL